MEARDPCSRRMARVAVVALFGLSGACGTADDTPGAVLAPSPRQPSPSPSPSLLRPPDMGRDVTFPAPGEGEMQGSLFGKSRLGVVLSPQRFEDRSAWFPLARVLEKRGYMALSIDSQDEDLDGEVIAAADLLRRKGASEVFAVGASKGATAVLGAAARSKELAGVVAVSPVLSFGDVTLTRPSIRSLRAPALVIVDKTDSSIYDVEELERWDPDLRVERINGNGTHGTAYLSSGQRGTFLRTVLRFLQE